MAVILPSVYKDGTATVNNGSTTVTGQNTLFVNSVLPGDFFGSSQGVWVRIASVDSNTTLTLSHPWPEASQTANAYEIMLQSDNARMQETSRQLLETLSSGNAYSLSQLDGMVDDIPIFQSPGVFTIVNKQTLLNASMQKSVYDPQNKAADAFSRANHTGQTPDASINATLTPDKAFRRGNVLGVVSQAGGVPTGALLESGTNANGSYVRFADGTQICWKIVSMVTGSQYADGSLFVSTEVNSGSWAAAFSNSGPLVVGASGTDGRGGGWVSQTRFHDTTGSGWWRTVATVSFAGAGFVYLMGVGRWF